MVLLVFLNVVVVVFSFVERKIPCQFLFSLLVLMIGIVVVVLNNEEKQEIIWSYHFPT